MTASLIMEQDSQQSIATDEQYIATFFCRALYDYQTTDASSLSFRKGQVIEVLTKLESGWWDGLLDDERGWFPSNYVTVISDSEAESMLEGSEYSMTQNVAADDSMLDMGHSMSRALSQSDVDGDWLQTELEYTRQPLANGNGTRAPAIQHSDFWVPQVSPDGRIFYVNTKTGQQSRDLPREVAEESGADLAGLTVQSSPRAGTGFAGALNGVPEEPETPGFGVLKRSTTPEPWIKRLADDGMSYFYVNKLNGEMTWTLPEANESSSYNDEQALMAMRGNFSMATSPQSGSSMSARLRSDSSMSRTRDRSESSMDRLSIYSDDSDVHPHPRDRATSSASRPTNGLSRPSTSGSSQPYSQPLAPHFEPSRVEQYATALQESLSPPAPESTPELTSRVQESINAVMSYLQAATAPRRPEQYKEVDMRVLNVVKAVRNLLYVAATPNGHIPAHLYPRDGREVRPSLSSQTLQSQLKAAHRKVAGTLSKLVLSALAMQYDPGLSASDKPNRMESDVMELERAVMAFVREVQVVQEQDPADPSAKPPMKRLHGVFSPANIGMGLYGAGAAAGWKGFGYVPLEQGVRGPTRILQADTIAEVKVHVKSVAERLAAMTLVLKRAEHDEERFRSDGQVAISHLANLLTIVGDTNIAAHVDLEELYLEANPTPVQVQYAQSIDKGRILIRALELTLQVLFDDSTTFLETIQTFPGDQPNENEERAPYTRLEALISSIRSNSNSLVQCLDSLLTIGQDQSVMGRFDRDTALERPSRSQLVDGLAEVETLEEDVVDFELAFTRGTPFRNVATPDTTSASTTLYSANSQGRNLSIESAARSRSDSASEPATPTWGQYDPPGNGSMTTESMSPVDMPDTLDDVPTRFIDDEEPAASTSKSPARPAGRKLLQVLGSDAPQHYIAKLNAEANPWYLRPNYDQSEILMDPDGGVKAGTPSALVERLTAHEHADATFIKNFLMTFKSFMSVDELFELLVKRFWIEPPPDLKPAEFEEWVKLKQLVIRIRVLNTFKNMIIDDDVLEKDDMYILARMKEFVSNEEVVNFAAAKQLLILIERAQRGDDALPKTTTSVPLAPPAPIVPKASKKLKLLDIDMLELARQLTLMEAHLYKKIRPVECLQRSRESRPGRTIDNITSIIQLSNRIANWVAESVLSKEDSKKRANVVKHLIGVADRCRTLQNYSTLAALVAGLNTPPIRRLKRTWEQVGARPAAQLRMCEETIDTNKNFNNYRSTMARISPPCVPFIGVYLTTLTFINDGAEDKLAGHMINFRKRQKAAEVIQDIKRWQAKPYNFQTVPSVMSYLEEAFDKYNEGVDYGDQFWNLSLEREPREREDEKMARLLQESGFL